MQELAAIALFLLGEEGYSIKDHLTHAHAGRQFRYLSYYSAVTTQSGGPMRHAWCFVNEEANKSVKEAVTNFQPSECIQRSNHIANLWKHNIAKDWNNPINCETLSK